MQSKTGLSGTLSRLSSISDSMPSMMESIEDISFGARSSQTWMVSRRSVPTGTCSGCMFLIRRHSVSSESKIVRAATTHTYAAEAGHKPGESIVCTGKIKHAGSSYIKDWEFLKGLVPADRVKELKITLAAPEWYHLRYKKGRAYPKDVYANDAEYFADIAEAYKTELQILYDAGCRNVTIDDPNLACGCNRWSMV